MENTFKQRTREFWDTLSCERQKYEDLIKQAQEKTIEPDAFVEEFTNLLHIVFTDPFFNVGMNDGKYELILTPEGNRNTLLLLNYWISQMPEDLTQTWNIYTTKPAMSNLSHQVGLEMYGKSIKLGDVEIYYSTEGDKKKLDLEIYSPKLMELEENQRYSALFILLDICIGEINVMQNIGAVEFVDKEPHGAKPVTLVELKAVLEQTFQTKGWELSTSPLDNYFAYQLEPSGDGLREDIFVGYSCSADIINNYMRKEDDLFLSTYQEGAVYGYVYYNNEQVATEEITSLRQQIEDEILSIAQQENVASIIGGATGNKYSYIDFIIYDINEFIPIVKKVLANYEFSEKGYSDFIYSAKPTSF